MRQHLLAVAFCGLLASTSTRTLAQSPATGIAPESETPLAPLSADPLAVQPPDFSPPPRSACGCAHCRSGGHAVEGPLTGECHPAVLSEAWCRRPLYADVFFGALTGNELQGDLVDVETGFFGGVRLGHDLDERWAVEGRLGLAGLDLSNTEAPAQPRTGDLIVGDISLVCYLTQHPRTRPFLSAGAGFADWEFSDAFGNSFTDTQAAVPLSVGIKQRYDDWLVFRFDLTDNIVFGGGTIIGTEHLFSATGSLELRFGGSRTSYWPWRRRTVFW